MPTLKVISPGFMTTVQDAGRLGFAHLGVSPAGAADPLAYRAGNLLVENSAMESALEMTLIGGSFQFESDTVIAITGAECAPRLDGNPIPAWMTIAVRGGQVLECGAMKNGSRTYLCIRGGIQLKQVMGSASTHLQTGVGGWEGRQLKKGDELPLASLTESESRIASAPREWRHYLNEKHTLRVTAGPQAGLFSADSMQTLCSSVYAVSESSNRVGLRLKGTPIQRERIDELVTEGVSLGALQVPNDGLPIILFVEHPTTGGYPKIANVILADMCRVGQLRPRDTIRFELVTMDHAEGLLRRQHEIFTREALRLEQKK